MNPQLLTQPVAALLGMFAVASALAQTAPTVTDVQPAPAESRNSVGAVELERSPVRAKRDSMDAAPTQSMGAAPAVSRETARSQARTERANKRAAEAAEARRRGAGGQTQN